MTIVPVHLVPAQELGRLVTHCLACGAPLDLSHTNPPYRYATDDAGRNAIAQESAGRACPCVRTVALPVARA